jgi:ABC-2 type transport system permease protein
MNQRKSFWGHPLVQLTLARLYEFWRHPEALFWTYGFPLIMLLALGLAFRSNELPPPVIELVNQRGNEWQERLEKLGWKAEVSRDSDWKKRLQSGKVSAVIVETEGQTELWIEPSRAESFVANYGIQLAAAESKNVYFVEKKLEEAGSRYIDFLVPGMLALNIMGGGLWGIGFVIVDMRVRKLLKRLMATPMSKRHFMGSLIVVRLLFSICELSVILLFSYFVFGVKCRGNLVELVAVMTIGGVTFSAIGLLMASRVKTSEAVGGLMNLIMLPMWIVGGVFFSNERFPEWLLTILQSLPFVALVNAVRAIMLDGATLTSQLGPLAVVSLWGIVCFFIAIRIFRWR